MKKLIKTSKLLLESLKEMYFFKKGCTIYPRWFEILLGLTGWFCFFGMCYYIFKIYTK